MTSEPIRDPCADHLLTPQNSALQILFGGERPLAGARSEPAGQGSRAGR